MITVFGHFESTTSARCVDVTFDGGRYGGNVTFTECGLARSTTIYLSPNEIYPAGCIYDDFTFSNQSMLGILNGLCSSIGSDIGGGSGPNAFAVERMSDGFSTYAQYNSNWMVNDIVSLSNDGACYEIMSEQVVGEPSSWPQITGGCIPGGFDGPKLEP